MGFFDRFRREKALTASPAVVEAVRNGSYNQYVKLGGVNQQVQAAWLQSQSSSYAFMYERQPAVRRVVDYIARNTAQLGLKLYERRSDTERERDTTHAAALTMAHPNDLGPADQFIFNYVADYLVHDNAYALKFRGRNGGPRTLIQVPAPAVAVNAQARFVIDSYRIYRSDGTYIDVAPEDVIHWRGYNPSDPRIGVSRLETLRQLLAQSAAADTAITELYKSGLAKPGYIKRPLDAPELSAEGANRVVTKWANDLKSAPRRTPMLEEGMEFADFGVSPEDAEMLASRKFTNDEVASLYGMEHCPPEDDEERKQFIADVLAPLTGSLAKQLNFSLLEAEYGESDYYFEFDLNEKLRGDLETRFPAMTAAAGRPWRTVNETRALENLPAIEGGDELTIPLNVQIGDNPRPAPNVMPIQDPNEPPQDGSHRERSLPQGKALLIGRQAAQVERRDRYADELKALFVRFYGRQERSVKSAKAVDSQRWNRELADDLEKALTSAVEREGDIAAQRFGMAGIDTRKVRNYLRSMSEDIASNVNSVTQAELSEADAADVFARAKSERAPVAAMSIATAAASFAHMEAARQSPDADKRTKTWVVTSSNSAHPELDGETVALGETFSNGSEGPPADHPGCECSLSIT